ncbi:hypothetical protein GCM10009779_70190 [Polymorphospora rubra]|uniref:Uncharacterized protein n=1 Tax=Polymorphospora rubra TaxID=338584 RepID=A0A810N8R0_9ACTN|nr:hypothetical protein Prubr_64410 [Polymorphospora rubra]
MKALHPNGLVGSMGRVGATGDKAAMEAHRARLQTVFWTGNADAPATTCAWRS